MVLIFFPFRDKNERAIEKKKKGKGDGDEIDIVSQLAPGGKRAHLLSV